MAAVGSISPRRHFPGDERPGERRPHFRKEKKDSQRLTCGLTRDTSIPRGPDVVVNPAQLRTWTTSDGAASGGGGGSSSSSSNGSVGSGVSIVSGGTKNDESNGSASQRSLEEGVRALNMDDKKKQNWVRIRPLPTGYPLTPTESNPLVAPGSAAVSRDGNASIPKHWRREDGPGNVENGWPPLVGFAGSGTGVAHQELQAASVSPSIVRDPPIATVAVTTAKASIVTATATPAGLVPVRSREKMVPSTLTRRIPRSLSCDGWVEPTCAPRSISSDFRADAGQHALRSVRQVRPSVPAVHSSGPGVRTPEKSPSSGKPRSPPISRGRLRGVDWDRSASSTPPPPPPPPPPPLVPVVASAVQQQQHQQQPMVQHPHVPLHQRYPAWDGVVPSPPRPQQQQQQQQQPPRPRYAGGSYEIVYWQHAPAPGTHTVQNRAVHVLSSADHHMILQHRQQHQQQLQQQQQQQQLQQQQQQQQREQQQRDQQKQRDQRDHPQAREQSLQRDPYHAREHQQQQQRGRARTETVRNVLQGPLGGRRLSPTRQESTRRPLSPPPSSVAHPGALASGDWQRHQRNVGGAQHRSPPRPVYFPPPSTVAATAAGSSGIPAAQIVRHAGFQPHPESGGHVMYLGVPPNGLSVVSIDSRAAFSPCAVVTHLPLQHTNVSGAPNAKLGINGNASTSGTGTSRAGSSNAGSISAGTSSGGGGGGNKASKNGGNAGTNGAGSVVSYDKGCRRKGDGSRGGEGGRNLEPGTSKGSSEHVASNGRGKSTTHVRVRVHASSLPPEPRSAPHRPPRGSELLVTASGLTLDNRSEVIALAPALEKKRRMQDRVGYQEQEEAPPITEVGDATMDDIGVDFGDFRAPKRAPEEEDEADGWGPRQNTGPVLGGWDECHGVGTSSGSCTGTISSVERADGGWGGTSSSLSSSCGDGGRWEDSGGSASGSTVSDGMDVEEGWSNELRRSIGVVTDLVLPLEASALVDWKRAPRAEVGRGGWGAEEPDQYDEEEREMAAALEAIYDRGQAQLKRHAERNARGTRQRATDAWLATRTPQQQDAYRERTQR